MFGPNLKIKNNDSYQPSLYFLFSGFLTPSSYPCRSLSANTANTSRVVIPWSNCGSFVALLFPSLAAKAEVSVTDTNRLVCRLWTVKKLWSQYSVGLTYRRPVARLSKAAFREFGLFEQVWRPALLVIQPDFVTIGRIMLFSSVNILNSKYLLAKFDKRAHFLRSSDKGRK